MSVSRRTATLVVSGLLLVLLVALAGRVPVPYVSLAPGPTADTLGEYAGESIIEIEGRPTFPADGHLNLTTVSVSAPDSLGLLEAFRGWLDGDVAIVPRETQYPEDVEPEQIEQRNAEDMRISQQAAATAALRELGISVTTTTVIAAIIEDTPAVGALHAGDVILEVDGQQITSASQVGELVRRHQVGENVRFRVERDGTPMTYEVRTEASHDDGETVPMVGIQVGEKDEYPFDIDISVEDIGGPSAGLMLALGIIEKLTEDSITGGQFIAGTGKIDDQGRVGPIGGVEMKVIGARRAGASVFLTPEANCAAARSVDHSGLRLVRVRDLHGAREALDALRTGNGEVPTC